MLKSIPKRYFAKVKLLRLILFPVSLVYGGITTFRNWCYDLGWFPVSDPSIPTISVGNLSTGGTGKSPHIEYLIRQLQANYKVATLSRGYGRKSRGFLRANAQSTATDIGDEPLQFANKFSEIAVTVCEKRVQGIRNIREQLPDTEIVLLDDAFQHRAVKPGLSILLTTYDAPFYNDWVLPTGNLRETKRGAARADVLVVTKCPPDLSPEARASVEKLLRLQPHQQAFFSSVQYSQPVPLAAIDKSDAGIDLDQVDEALVVTGIANGRQLYDHLSVKIPKIRHLDFPDHHNYTAADLKRVRKIFDNFAGSQRAILTTEKDAMRLAAFTDSVELASLPVYYIPIEITFLHTDKANFDERISNYLGAN